MSKDLCYILFSLQIVPIMNLKYSVGLDVSSKKIDACISVIDISQKVRVLSIDCIYIIVTYKHQKSHRTVKHILFFEV